MTTHPLSDLSPEFIELINGLAKTETIKKEDVPTITISMTTGKAAFLYERIRNTIGYQEEQMLRRLAITRIISRRANFDTNEKAVASGLLWELIQSGYFKNGEVPEEKIPQVQKILQKYSAIEKYIPEIWCKHFFGIMGTEIEGILVDYSKEEKLVKCLHSLLMRYHFEDKKETAEYQVISDMLYYSLIQHFYKLDKPALRYHALKFKLPKWTTTSADESILLEQDLQSVIYEIEENIKALPSSKFPKIAKKYYPLYFILQKLTTGDAQQTEDILTNKQKLTIYINKITSEYFSQTMSKLNRSIIKAVLFIFATKVLLGLIFEIPYDKFLHGAIHYQPLLINIVFPPLLMFISVSMISLPGADNSKKIIAMAKKFIYNEGADDKEKKRYGSILYRSRTLDGLLSFLYVITFLLTIFALGYLLKSLGFNLVSGFLFFLFLSIVSFFAFRIRKSATDMVISEEKENAFAVMFDFLLLPFLKIGFWLSKRFENANVLVMIFDFILEAPFKTILEAIEHWIAFVKEKKEEIAP